MDLNLIYQALTTHKVTLEDLGQILRRIYANGYMDSTEEQELELLTHTSSFVEVPKQVKESIQKLLSHHIYLTSQYRRFEKDLPASLQSKNLQSPAGPSIRVQFISLMPLPEDGYQLTLQLTKARGQLVAISIELPNKKGLYKNGMKAGQEDSLLLKIQKSLAWQVLQEHVLPEEEKRVVLEAVGRMGNPPLNDRVKPDFVVFRPQDAFPFDEIAQRAKEKCQKGTNLIIRGLAFQVPYTDPEKVEQLRTIYEAQLESLPDYVLLAIQQKIRPIVIYEPEQLLPKFYGDLLAHGKLTKTLDTYQSWTRFPDKDSPHQKPTLYISLGSAPNSLVHEFGHVLTQYEPSRSAIPKYYLEEVVPTNYAGSPPEHFAEALMIFYQGQSFRPNRVGTREELKQEDPSLYLTLVQMDALLEDQFSKNGRQKGPGYEAATTLIAEARTRAYLKKEGAHWDDPEKIKLFRQGTLELDVSDERAFLRSAQEGSYIDDLNLLIQNKITLDVLVAKHRKYFEAAEKMADHLPDDPFFAFTTTIGISVLQPDRAEGLWEDVMIRFPEEMSANNSVAIPWQIVFERYLLRLPHSKVAQASWKTGAQLIQSGRQLQYAHWLLAEESLANYKQKRSSKELEKALGYLEKALQASSLGNAPKDRNDFVYDDPLIETLLIRKIQVQDLLHDPGAKTTFKQLLDQRTGLQPPRVGFFPQKLIPATQEGLRDFDPSLFSK